MKDKIMFTTTLIFAFIGICFIFIWAINGYSDKKSERDINIHFCERALNIAWDNTSESDTKRINYIASYLNDCVELKYE